MGLIYGIWLSLTVSQFLVTTIAFLQPHARGYIDPLTGHLFGEGKVEKSLHAVPAEATGGVIMDKLGNATAKKVFASNHTISNDQFFSIEPTLAARHGSYCMYILF